MSAPRGHTMIFAVTGLAPHHLSLATSTTEPSLLTDSILYGPDDGNRLASKSSERRFHVLFHTFAMRSTAGPSLLSSAVVTSMPSSSEITCDGIIDVAAKSWPKSTNARSWPNVALAFFCPGEQSTEAMPLDPARLAASSPGSRPHRA